MLHLTHRFPRGAQNPKAASPDGKRIVFTEIGETSANDLSLLLLDEKRTITPLVQTAFFKNDPSISPDGHWLAYESSESGESEIYVRPFPDVTGGLWRVSTTGGSQPQWARNGRELFYLDRGRYLTSVRVETSPTFAAATPNKVLDTRYYSANGPWTYDVSSDGQRFLMLKDTRSVNTNSTAPSSIVVVLNWTEELKRLVPTR